MKIPKLFVILFTVLLCSATTVFGQAHEPRLDVDFTDIPLAEAISQIEKNSKYTFFYDAKSTDLKQKVSLQAHQMPISEAIGKMLAPTGMGFSITERQIALFPTRKAEAGAMRTISGTVYEDDDTPLPGVSVTIAGNNLGVVTDIDGNFSISAPADKVKLTFAFLGYAPKTVTVSPSQDKLSVLLSPDAVQMDDLVVIGYGTQKKVNLTGAIATVDQSQLKDRPASTVTHMLQGVVPGVTVTTSSGRPGNSASINIRGITSINGGSPLVLIDGAEGTLDKVNPNDVANISVIKDASAAAIYGARAAYGVVLVTTKEGDTSGKTRVSYSGRMGWTESTTSTDYETRGYYSVYINDMFWHAYAGTNYTRYTEQDMMELWARRNDVTEHPDRPWTVIDQRNGRDTYVYYGNTDWYHYLFRDTHPTANHSISLSGGNSHVKYLLSGNYNSEEGVFRKNTDKNEKYNFRSKITFDINKWFKISNNTSYFSSKYIYPGASSVNTSFSLMTVHALASFVPKNPDGTNVYGTAFSKYELMDGLPMLLDNEANTNEDRNDNFSTTTELTWAPIKGLEVKGNFTYMFNNNRYLNRSNNSEYSMYPGEILTKTNGRFQNCLSESSQVHRYYQTNIFATYSHTFAKDHNFTAMAGFNYETKHYKDIKAIGYNLYSSSLNDLNLVGPDPGSETGAKRVEVSGGQNEYALMGYFARLGYDYKGKYLVEANGRYDGTSRFKRGQRWGFFPSFSLGWRLSEENFFEGLRSDINNLKLRLSYGKLGNQNVGYYDYIRKISISNQSYLFGGDKPTTATISAPVASDLSWETSVHKNIGLDMSFFNNRLAFSSDFYIRDTKDMLTDGLALPNVYGASSPKMNSADLRTKGYELSLSWRDGFNLLGKSFSYFVNLTFNDYVTDITRFENPEKTFAKPYYEGMRWGEIWGFRTGGLFASDEEAKNYPVDQTLVNSVINSSSGAEKGLRAGDIKFLDLDNSQTISIGKNTVNDPGDRRIIGNSQPRYHYGATVGFSYVGIDFSMFFQGIGRQDWYPEGNSMAFWGPYARPYATLIPSDFINQIWSEDNPNAYFPRPRGYVALTANSELTVTNDRYLQNIGYCRLKNLTVGYTLPKKLTRKALIENLRVYFSGENLAYWSGIHSDYIDPELAAVSGTLRIYPWQKTFTFGLDVTF